MRKRKIVLVDAPTETLTNAPIPIKGYNFSMKFSSNTYRHDLEGFRNDMGILFDCNMDPPFVEVFGTVCSEVKGHETIYFSSYKCFIARNQPCVRICIDPFCWQVFHIGNGQEFSAVGFDSRL